MSANMLLFSSVRSYRILQESLGLYSTWKQKWTVESASVILSEARQLHPRAGIRDLQNAIRSESNGGMIRILR